VCLKKKQPIEEFLSWWLFLGSFFQSMEDACTDAQSDRDLLLLKVVIDLNLIRMPVLGTTAHACSISSLPHAGEYACTRILR
jgi:hypothetical protein